MTRAASMLRQVRRAIAAGNPERPQTWRLCVVSEDQIPKSISQRIRPQDTLVLKFAHASL